MRGLSYSGRVLLVSEGTENCRGIEVTSDPISATSLRGEKRPEPEEFLLFPSKLSLRR